MHHSTRKTSSIDIWFAEIGDASMSIEQHAREYLSPSELCRLSCISSLYKRREYLLSRAVMRHALSCKFGFAKNHWVFRENAGQAPKIINLQKEAYTSLSHSKGLICFAISDHAIGIDLETIKPRENLKTIAIAVMNKNEITYLNEPSTDYILRFYELWCSKEAIYKMLPMKEQSQTQLSSLSAFNFGKYEGQILLNNFDHYVFSIASKEPSKHIQQYFFPQNPNTALLSKVAENKDNYYHFPSVDFLTTRSTN